MKTLTYTVVFRDNPDTPQQEIVRYTKESANHFAFTIIQNGGVAIVIESEEEAPDRDY